MLVRVLFFSLILMINVSFSLAQSASDDFKKNEFYAGFSTQRIERNFQNGFDFQNGFEVAAVRNVHRYFGIKGDFSAAFRSQTLIGTAFVGGVTNTFPVRVKNQTYNFLGGIQIKDNASSSRLKPFGHVLAGAGYRKIENTIEACQPPNANNGICSQVFPGRSSDTGFAGAVGGGLDVRINDRIDVRAIQVDYNPVYLNHRFQNNVRFGIGIVFK